MFIPLIIQIPRGFLTLVKRANNTYKCIEPVLNLNWYEGMALVILVAPVTAEISIVLIHRIKTESVVNPTDVVIIISWSEPSRNSDLSGLNTTAITHTPTSRRLI